MLTAPELPAGTADRIAERILRSIIGSGLVDHPLPAASAPSTLEHRELARRAAVAGTVLLANRDQALPLSEDVRTVGVIGPAGWGRRLHDGRAPRPSRSTRPAR